MNQLIIASIISASMFLLSGCGVDAVSYNTVDTVVYDPGYSSDYVYSVGYFNNRPYWGNNYHYFGYGSRRYGSWGGGRY